jgi:hypothetical protein
MTTTKQVKTWEVTVQIPDQEPEVIQVQALDNMDAKAEASKQYYGSVFTGQFKYMRAQVLKEGSSDNPTTDRP